MKLTIVTPLSVIVEENEVSAVRAEDDSGSFGILPGHADFLTSLTVSVVSWRNGKGGRHYCAVRGGFLTVNAGQSVAIATREAVIGDDLQTLDQTVLQRFRAERELERTEHVETTRLHLNAVRQIVRRLNPRGGDGLGGYQ